MQDNEYGNAFSSILAEGMAVNWAHPPGRNGSVDNTERIVGRVATLILGGGRGTRLFPLTRDRAKPAISFGGKYRLIDIPISNSINSGIRKIFVLTQFLSAGLHRHITRTYRLDNFSDGFVEILAAEQSHTHLEWFQGTADAVRQNLRYLLRGPVENFLILAGDQFYRMDFRSMLASHIYHAADVTIAATLIPRDDVSRMGILRCEQDGKVLETVEKPEKEEVIKRLRAGEKSRARFIGDHAGKDHIGSMGIYIFKREALVSLLDDHSMQSFAAELIPQAIKKYRVYSHPFGGYWVDVGTIRSFFEANLDLTDMSPHFNLYQWQNPVFSRHRSLPAAKIMRGNLAQAIVGEGSIVEGASLARVIVGLRSVINAGTTINNSIVLGNDHMFGEEGRTEKIPEIGPDAYIENAIVDKNVSVGAGSRIVGGNIGTPDRDEELYHIRDGLVVVPQGISIPPGSLIEA